MGLLTLIKDFPFISVIYTNNIGPHRKLLPLLSKKYKEDCVIVTIDDHDIHKPDFIHALISYYLASNKESVVALRLVL